MKRPGQIAFEVTVIILIILTSLSLSKAFYDQAHMKLGLHGKSIAKFLSKNVTGTRAIWYNGYENIEESFFLAGEIFGFLMGFAISLILFCIYREAVYQLAKKGGDKQK